MRISGMPCLRHLLRLLLFSVLRLTVRNRTWWARRARLCIFSQHYLCLDWIGILGARNGFSLR